MQEERNKGKTEKNESERERERDLMEENSVLIHYWISINCSKLWHVYI